MPARHVDIEDVVSAHLRADELAPTLAFARYIISATSPFIREDAAELASDAPAVVRRLFPDQPAEYAKREWGMFPHIDRVYDNTRARSELGWSPQYDFRRLLENVKSDGDPRSPLARTIRGKELRRGQYGSVVYEPRGDQQRADEDVNDGRYGTRNLEVSRESHPVT